MKIYFDNCCLNRPFDDLRDNAVRLEAEAVLSIIDYCESGEWSFFGSDVLLDEIREMPNADRQEKVLLLYSSAASNIDLTDAIVSRAKELELFGIKLYDALHLASAEAGGAEILLTTDRGFIKAAKRSNSNVPAKNPLVWLAEVLYDSES
jgi:predicted nucleic acid-binding protein